MLFFFGTIFSYLSDFPPSQIWLKVILKWDPLLLLDTEIHDLRIFSLLRSSLWRHEKNAFHRIMQMYGLYFVQNTDMFEEFRILEFSLAWNRCFF